MKPTKADLECIWLWEQCWRACVPWDGRTDFSCFYFFIDTCGKPRCLPLWHLSCLKHPPKHCLLGVYFVCLQLKLYGLLICLMYILRGSMRYCPDYSLKVHTRFFLIEVENLLSANFLQEEFVKWKDCLFFHFVSVLVDPNPDIAR